MRYILIILFSIVALSAKAQFTGTDSLRNYNNRYVTTNPATAFTNNRLNTLLRGIIDFIDTARAGGSGAIQLGIDTVFAVNDSTIRYRKNGVFRQFTLKGVYDSRRKVDTIYKSNDTTLTFTVNGNLRTVIIPGGTNLNLATANQTATGNRTHNWDNHWLYFNNIKSFGIYQDQPDANHVNNNFKTQITTDSSIDGTPLQLMWGIRNINDDIIDSVHFELTSKDSSTYLHHWGADTAKSVKLSLNGNAPTTDICMDVASSSKVSSYKFGHVASIEPADSIRLKLASTSATSKIIGARAESSGIWTPVVIDIPTSGVSALNNIGTGYALVATPGGNVKKINNNYGILIDSTTTANTITIRADTASTNHVVTQSDLNDAIAGAVGNQNIQHVLNIGDTSNRPVIYKFSEDTTDGRYDRVTIPTNFGVNYGVEGTQMGFTSGLMRANYVNASGRPNIVYNLAMYNTSNGGGRISVEEAAYRFGLESHFNISGQRLFEFHLPEITTYSGIVLRPNSLYVNKETGGVQFHHLSTDLVTYTRTDGGGLLDFGSNGNYTMYGYGDGSFLHLIHDSATGSQYHLNVKDGSVEHKTFSAPNIFDSQIRITNNLTNESILDLTDTRTATASNIGMKISISGTSQSKHPIQIEANTTGGIVEDFENGTGPNELKVLGNGNALVTVNNISTTDPAGSGYNAAFTQWVTGTDYSFIGMNYGTSAGPYTGTQLFYRTVTSAPHVWYVGSAQMMRLNSTGFGIGTISPLFGLHVNRSMGINKDSVTHRSTTGARQMLVLDTANNSVERMDIPSGGSSYTFSNGITESAGAVKWGGTLTQNTTIDGSSSYTTTFTGSRTSANSTLLAENSSSGRGITGSSSSGVGAYGSSTSGAGITGQSSSGSGVFGLSSSGVGVQAQSTTGQALTAISPNTNGAASITANPSSTNTTHTVLRLTRLSTSAGANNIAGSIDFDINNSTGAGSVVTANQIVSKLTTATAGSEVAQFDVWGYNSGVNYRRFSILGTGQMEWPYYGSGTYTGTISKYIGVTSAGAVVEQAASTIPLISAGTAAPATTPGKVGDIYVDTTNKKLYFATGTSSSADWTIAN